MPSFSPLSYAFLFLFFVRCSSLYSQGTFELPKPKHIISKYEILIGPSWLIPYKSKTVDHPQFKIGYCFGIGISHAFNNRVEIAVNVLFERKGRDAKFDAFYDTNGMYHQLSYDENRDYLTATLIPKYCFGTGRNFRLGVGPYASKLTKSVLTQTITLNGQVASVHSSNQLPSLKNYDYGIVFTASYDTDLFKKTILRIGVSANLGLINANVENPAVPTEKNQSLYLLITLLYNR